MISSVAGMRFSSHALQEYPQGPSLCEADIRASQMHGIPPSKRTSYPGDVVIAIYTAVI